MTDNSTVDPRTFLPLPPLDFQVLLDLAAGPKHAYGLATPVEVTRDDVRLELGSLYRILARLSSDGLIEETEPRRDESRPDARRRYYQLTALGRAVAGAEARRLEGLIRTARAQRLLVPRRK